MSTIGIVFLIIAVVFFVLGTFMYIVQKIITNRIYHEENEEVKEEKPKKKIVFTYTFKKTVSIFKQMFVTVKYLVTGGISLSQLSGPVGIYSIVGQTRSAGIANVLYLMAFLSINVGFINLLPIPAFDGGHILFIVIELIKGSPVKPEIENMIHTIFLFLLMLLMVVITINDVIKLF